MLIADKISVPDEFFADIEHDEIVKWLLGHCGQSEVFSDTAAEPSELPSELVAIGITELPSSEGYRTFGSSDQADHVFLPSKKHTHYASSVCHIIERFANSEEVSLRDYLSEHFGWQRCRTCKFFVRDEWSDDVGYMGYCKETSENFDEDKILFCNFGCVNYEYSV